MIVVWIDMLPSDNRGAAQSAAEIFASCPQVVQFHDPKRFVGKAIATSLGSADKIAWDIYLIYTPGATWVDAPPQPLDWVHQLGQGEWAGEDKYHHGEALYPALRRMLQEQP